MDHIAPFHHSQDAYNLALTSSHMSSQSPSPESCICPQDVTRSEDCEDVSDDMTIKSDGLSQSLVDGVEQPKKKRKSWGQVLPKPTTNLPPRKRAKTEEEKAQRKYERVQRNRHAAHMSRMRKQDEMEQLKHENDVLKQDNESLNQEIARLRDAVDSQRSSSHHHTAFPSPSRNFEPFNTPELTSSPSESSVDFDNGVATPPPLMFPESNPGADMKQSDASHSAVDVGFAGFASDKIGDNMNYGLALGGNDQSAFSLGEFVNLDAVADNTGHNATNGTNSAMNLAPCNYNLGYHNMAFDGLQASFDFNVNDPRTYLASDQFHLMAAN